MLISIFSVSFAFDLHPIVYAPCRVPGIDDKDPVVHVSIASVAGDVSSYVGASSDESRGTSFVGVGEGARGSNETRGKCDAGGDGSSSSSESEKDDTAPSEICIDVDMVVCKAGTSLFQAPFLTHG